MGAWADRRSHRRLSRVVTLALTAVLVVLGWVFGAGVAGATVTVVTVDPSTAEAGSTVITLTFRVPSQANTAAMVGFSLSLPADHPFAEVTPEPMLGWTAATATTTLGGPVTVGGMKVSNVITSVTWTAAPGAGVGPGGSAEFRITAGPVPAVDALRFPVTQNYNNGTGIRWDGPSSEGGRETLHPAPILMITQPGVATGGTTSTDSSHGPVTVVAVVGVLAVAAITAVGVLALRRRRGRPSAPSITVPNLRRPGDGRTAADRHRPD